ncbi:DUF2516 family protein [Demequina pelophila]|uniref:DUF2516 family protein n=1 Tax=Demequina pelophila TaxID=1638984 RepID=UPI000783FA5C|nr:DUF2516 family protein [Demequina pelophila]
MFGSLQAMVVLVISAAALAGAVWGVIDAARRPDTAFRNAGKLTKTIWLAILGVATLIAFISLPWPLGTGGGIGGILGIVSVVAVIVYFVDVRPKIGGPTLGGNSNRSSGGW